MIRRAHRLRGVFDDGYLVPVGDVQHGVEIARHVLEMDGDDRRGAIRDAGGQQRGIETERVVDLGEHRHRIRGDHRIHGGDEREGRDDHLVAAAHAQGRERAAERRRSVGHGGGVRGAECVARGPFEVSHGSRLGAVLVPEQGAAPDHRRHRVGLRITEKRRTLGEVEGIDPHRRAPVDGERRVVAQHAAIVR